MAGFLTNFLANFSEVLRILLPVFLVAGIGFIWARSGGSIPRAN